MNESEKNEKIATIIEIAKDAQLTHGCPNPTSLIRFCKCYSLWQESISGLTIYEISDAISTGYQEAEIAKEYN